ncbi:MAG: PilZ domain-containing protein, partial [Bryobacteraceae bacterium]
MNANRPQNDRRATDRFPIEREVQYKTLNKRGGEEAGEGKTVNISSNGVLFTTEHALLPGRRLELAPSIAGRTTNSTCVPATVRRCRGRSDATPTQVVDEFVV